ncbi:MAG: hypothetical protein KAU95_04685 [Candidatus Aenigmarchaeota archaeon]|nr:hypothetical protein [Candidatus Aenigmarchaeota archaeon]
MVNNMTEDYSMGNESVVRINDATDKSEESIQKNYLKEIIHTKFGSHRGLGSQEVRENSKEAIYRAIENKSVFVEFDVSYCKIDGTLRLGHPPQEPFEKLEEIYSLFKNTPTYPKVDIKFSDKDDYKKMIDKVIEQGNKSELDFILVNIGDYGEKNKALEVEEYFCSKIKNKPQFKLNIDLERYKNKAEEGYDEEIVNKHIDKYKERIYSVSPEINETDWEKTAEFCKEHDIKNIGFWLRGWPDNPNPKVQEETIKNALDIEKQYQGISIYFDIPKDKVIDNSDEYSQQVNEV